MRESSAVGRPGIFRSEGFIVYLTLIAGTLLAWLPLLGASLPVNDDFTFLTVIQKEGLAGYLRVYGFWRPLGQYPQLWLFLKNPAYHPLLVVTTHLIVVLLFFHLCRSLFGGVRLPLGAALVVAMVPLSYEAFTWIITYNYIVPMVFFLANLLLLIGHDRFKGPLPLKFCLSALLSLLAVLGNECVFFASAVCGLFALVEAAASPRGAAFSRAQGWLALAPLAGCLVWMGLFYAFPGPGMPKRVTSIHLFSVFGVYLRQYSLLDVFVPWFNPTTRSFLFAAWTKPLWVAVLACVPPFLLGLWRLSRPDLPSEKSRGKEWRTLLALLALLAGGSLIYVLAGGFTLDTRKKYPLVIFMLLLLCWLYRAAPWRRIPARSFFACAAALSIGGAMTAWMVVGIWKYEALRYNQLADFVVEHDLEGPLRIVLHPDIEAAWPQERRSLEFGFDDENVLHAAILYRGGKVVGSAGDGPATVVEFDPALGRWTLPVTMPASDAAGR